VYLDGRGFNFVEGNDDLALRPSRLRLTGKFFDLGLMKAGAVRMNPSAPKQLGRLSDGNESKSIGLGAALGGGGHVSNM